LFAHRGVDIARRQPDGSWLWEKGQPDSHLRVGGPVPRIESFEAEDRAEYDSAMAAARGASRDSVLVCRDLAEDFFRADLFVGLVDRSYLARGANVRDATLSDRSLTLETLVATIGDDEVLEGPPQRIVVVSHGYWQGELMFSTSDNDLDQAVTFESVDSVREALRLPDLYLNLAGGPPTLLFTGCEIAKAEPLLKKIRDAMNPKLAVYAPKFWYGILRDQTGASGFDFAEYMAQPFEVYADRALTRAELIEELKRRRKDALNQDIPQDEWQNMVVDDGTGAMPLGEFYERGGMGTFLWHEALEEPASAGTTATLAQFNADRLTTFRQAIAAVPAVPNPIHRFAPNHPFPMWKRFGFNRASDFIDKFTWSFEFTEASPGQPNIIAATGRAHHYMMLVPIGDATGRAWRDRRLICNRYVEGQTAALGPNPNFVPMPLTDTRFWGFIPPA
jgi:hypothetical protein